jgi:hypothetical protein
MPAGAASASKTGTAASATSSKPAVFTGAASSNMVAAGYGLAALGAAVVLL